MRPVGGYGKVVWLLLALALSVRLGYVIAHPKPRIADDALHYDDIAWNLASGRGFSMSDAHLLAGDRRPDGRPAPTARRPPLYPLFLSVFYRAFGRTYPPVLGTQAVVGAIACFFVFLLARDAFGKRAGVAALLLSAIYPPFVKYCAQLLTETLFLALTVAAFWAAHRAAIRDSAKSSVLSGLLGGLAALARPTAFFFVPLQAAVMLAAPGSARRRGRWLAHVAAYGLTFALVVSPWPARNYVVFGAFIPGFTSAGYNLFLGTFPESHGLANVDPSVHPEELKRELEGKGEVEADAIYRRAALRNLREHPFDYVRLVGMKALRGWFVIQPGHDWKPTPLSATVHGGLLALAVWGALRLRRSRGFSVLFVGTGAAAFTAFHALVVSNLRYNLPAVPFAIVLAAAALSELASRVTRNGRDPGETT